MVTGLPEEKKSTRPQPTYRLLYEGVKLVIAQVHQQPVREDEIDAEVNVRLTQIRIQMQNIHSKDHVWQFIMLDFTRKSDCSVRV